MDKIRRVCHISYVVYDIRKTIENWMIFLGLEEQPRIWNIPKAEEVPSLTNGKLEDYSDCQLAVIELENIVLEFVQPGQSDSPWKKWIEEHGEGYQHIAFLVEDRENAKKIVKEKLGVEDFYHIGYYPGGAYAFYDTKKALATEINLKDSENNEAIIKRILNK